MKIASCRKHDRDRRLNHACKRHQAFGKGESDATSDPVVETPFPAHQITDGNGRVGCSLEFQLGRRRANSANTYPGAGRKRPAHGG